MFEPSKRKDICDVEVPPKDAPYDSHDSKNYEKKSHAFATFKLPSLLLGLRP